MKFRANDYNKGEILKIIRQSTNLTQKEFAEKMGKSTRTIEDYEAGKQNYNIEFLKEVAEKFNIIIYFENKN